MAVPRLAAPRLTAAFYCVSAVLLVEAVPVVLRAMQRSLGPPRLEEVVAARAELIRTDLADASRVEGRSDLRRLALPDAWREREGKRRAPPSLHVYVDGAAIPFQYREPQQWAPEHGPTIAYYVSPRLSTLVVRCGPAAACRQAVVARDDAWLRLRLLGRRLSEHPSWLAVLAAASGACLALGALGARAWSLSGPAAATLGALTLLLWYGTRAGSRPNAALLLSAQALALLAPSLARAARAAALAVWTPAISAESTARARLARLSLLALTAFVAALPHLWLSLAWSPSELDDSFLYLFASSRLLTTGSLIEGLGRPEAWVYSGYPVVIATIARLTGGHPMSAYQFASSAGALLLPLALGVLAWSLSGRFRTGVAATWIAGLWGGLAGYAWLLTEAIPSLLAGRAPPLMETDYYESRFFGEYAGPHSELASYLSDPPFYPREVGLVLFWLTLAFLVGRGGRSLGRLLAAAVLGAATVVVYPYYGSSVFLLVAVLGAAVVKSVDPSRRRLARAGQLAVLAAAVIGLVVLADQFVANYLEPSGLLVYLKRLASGALAPPPSQAVDFQVSRVLSGHFFLVGVVGLLIFLGRDNQALAAALQGPNRVLLLIGSSAACLSGLAAALDPTAWRMLSLYRWVVPWRTLVAPFLVVLAAIALERLVERWWCERRWAWAILLIALPCLSPLHWTINAWQYWQSGIRGTPADVQRARYDEFTSYGASVLGRVQFREPLLLEGVPVVTGDFAQAAFGVTTVNNRSRARVPEHAPRLAHLLLPDAEPALRAASARGEIGDVMAVSTGDLARRLRASPGWCEVASFGRFVVLRPAAAVASKH